MANYLEIQREQKRHLFALMKVRVANKDVEINELDDLIIEAETEMAIEDVAYVREQIARLRKYGG